MRRVRRRFSLYLLLLPHMFTVSVFAQHGVDICYFGDSITEGWIEAVFRPGQSYPAKTDSLLIASGRDIRSLHSGRGGETTDDALARIDSDVLRHTPRIVILAFGSNDWFVWGNPPFQRVQHERYARNLRVLIRKVRGIGAIPVLLTPPVAVQHRLYALFDSMLYAGLGGAEFCSERYARTAAQVAREEHALWLESVSSDDRERFLGSDGVHLLAEGHHALAEALARLLSGILDSTATIPLTSTVDLYPVPYQPSTHQHLIVSIATRAEEEVQVRIIDFGGREVRKFVYFAWSAGTQYLLWDGRTTNGTPAAAGAYTVFVRAGSRYSRHQLLIL
ncbi:MAG: GDSL-type esterase/lipase family protein [Bacteroidia bacterium]|nr:GDSL-type esterase/lipase family protein [Bacteroidia bacterium]